MKAEISISFKANSTLRFDIKDREKFEAAFKDTQQIKNELITTLKEYVFGTESESEIEDIQITHKIIEDEEGDKN